MAFSQTNIGRVRLGKQTAWNDSSITFAARHLTEAEVFIPELATEMMQTESMRGDYSAYRSVSGSKANVSVSLKMPLHGWSSTTPSADPTASEQHVDSILLEYALGATAYSSGFTSKTIAASPGTTSSTNFGTGDAPPEGYCFGVPISATPTFAIGWGQDQSTDAMAWIQNLASAAHASSSDVLGSMINHMSTASPSTGLVMNYEGQDANTDITLSNGMVTRLKIMMAPNQQPTIEADLVFGAWALGTDGAPGLYEFTLPQMPVAVGNNGARMILNNVAVSDVFNVEFEVGIEYEPILGHSAAEGISQYLVTNRDATMTVTAPTTNANTDMSTLGGSSVGPLQVDLNTTAGRMFSILMSDTILENTRTLGDHNGVVGTTSVYKAGYYDNDGSDTAVGTPPADTLVRAAFL